VSFTRFFTVVYLRLQKSALTDHLRGALLRRKFTRAGIIVVPPGRPRVRVKNRGGQIVCGNCCFFPGVRLECLPGGHITIGNGTYLNRNTEVISASEVRIGRDCQISWDVVIMDTDQHGIGNRPAITRPVMIGDRVWIGCRAIILKGVTIGDNAVIGAGAIVTRDVPPKAIVTGPVASIRGYLNGAQLRNATLEPRAEDTYKDSFGLTREWLS
jgi:acetyltransferase-like isoleucine patch superfamily enzyme